MSTSLGWIDEYTVRTVSKIYKRYVRVSVRRHVYIVISAVMYTVSIINANTPAHLNMYVCGYESVQVADI